MKCAVTGNVLPLFVSANLVLHAVLEITYNAVMTREIGCLHRNVESSGAAHRCCVVPKHSAVAALVRLNAAPRGARKRLEIALEDSGA